MGEETAHSPPLWASEPKPLCRDAVSPSALWTPGPEGCSVGASRALQGTEQHPWPPPLHARSSPSPDSHRRPQTLPSIPWGVTIAPRAALAQENHRDAGAAAPPQPNGPRELGTSGSQASPEVGAPGVLSGRARLGQGANRWQATANLARGFSSGLPLFSFRPGFLVGSVLCGCSFLMDFFP